ncbi:MAG TPA: hypothetical protein VIJ25_20495 [Methylococcales bacterium]
MKPITKASRINIAVQVIQRMNNGMTVVEACKAVGIPRSSFYYIIENNPEAIAQAQAIIKANNREQLGLILTSKNEMLRKVIDAGLAEETKPKDRLAIFIKLSEIANGLTKGMGIDSGIENQAHEFLKHGPQLVQAKSRFTATQTTVTIESEP